MMQRAWMQSAFTPRGVAVVGACGDPSRLAWGSLRAVELSSSSPHGQQRRRPILAVDRRWHEYDSGLVGLHEVAGTTFVADPCEAPSEVAGCIDLAVVVTSRHRCLDRIRQCLDGFPHLRAINVVSGGFMENQRGDLEQRMVDMVRDAGVRLIGPNSAGTIDCHANFQTMFLRKFPLPGDISLVSQSGGICGSVVELLCHPRYGGAGMSKVISLGNAADVGVAEALRSVAEEDERTRVIMLYLEGLKNAQEGAEFVHWAEQIVFDKPIIALKAGLSRDAARAVSSHTGALAGDRRIYEAALLRAGIVQAASLGEMIDMAHSLSCRPRVAFSSSASTRTYGGSKYRAAVVSNAGGPAALAVDALVQSGAASVLKFSEPLRERIAEQPDVHKLSSTSNPVDLLGGATPCGYRSGTAACLSDPTVDAVVALHVPTALSCPEDIAKELIPVQEQYPPKPLVGMFVSEDHDYIKPALSLLGHGEMPIPTFCSSEGIASAFKAWKQREERIQLLTGNGSEISEKCLQLSSYQIERVRDYCSRLEPGWVLEHDARTLLDIIGIDQPKAELMHIGSGSKDAVDAAEKLGYPVVMKRVDSVHKSKSGGVAVDLQSSAQVVDAFDNLCGSVSSHPILVCEHVSSGLAFKQEFLIGASRDDIFGPAMCFGLGGSIAQTIGDVAFALPPRTRAETEDLLKRTKILSSEPHFDLSALAQSVEKISAMIRLCPSVTELDVNPIIVGLTRQGETRTLAVDIKFRLDNSSTHQ